MRILVVGSGGREHALCWSIAASPLTDKLYCAPGNAGIAEVAECVSIAAEDVNGLVVFARANAIDFVVVGPEAPLVKGLADRLEEAGVKAFGPGARGAHLEGSKGFMKDLCTRHGVPTAAYGRFTYPNSAKAFLRVRQMPIVVKADGLAQGKGVIVAQTLAEADAAVDAMLVERRFGEAGDAIVIEDCLEGEEASFFALVDGMTALPLAAAQDHKRAGEGDSGPNTGGMGAYSPTPIVDEKMAEEIMTRIVRPTVRAMAEEGRLYKGVLYAGLMIGPDGPRLLEFNVRFGDPETQVLAVRLKSDLLAALLAARDGVLKSFDLRWHERAALTVVMASKGYPGEYRKGTEIRGLERARALPDVSVFHAATRLDEDGRLLADGGRVLGVTALGRTVAEAKARAYQAVDLIDWPDGYCRRDIGARAAKP